MKKTLITTASVVLVLCCSNNASAHEVVKCATGQYGQNTNCIVRDNQQIVVHDVVDTGANTLVLAIIGLVGMIGGVGLLWKLANK